MMRARLIPVTALALLLAACIGGGGQDDAPAVNPITGGSVAVTSLDAPPAGVPPQPALSAAPAAPALEAELSALRATGGQDGATASPAPPPQTARSTGEASGDDAGAAPASAPEADAPPPQPRSDAQIACEGTGGTWGRAGETTAMTCFRPTDDGGRSCRRESDCSTLCLSRSRTCAPVTPLFGCHPILQDDGREVTLCLD